MPGDKMLMSLGVEEYFGFTGVVALNIPGVVSPGVTGKVAIWVHGVVDLGITGVFACGICGKVAIWVTGKVFF